MQTFLCRVCYGHATAMVCLHTVACCSHATVSSRVYGLVLWLVQLCQHRVTCCGLPKVLLVPSYVVIVAGLHKKAVTQHHCMYSARQTTTECIPTRCSMVSQALPLWAAFQLPSMSLPLRTPPWKEQACFSLTSHNLSLRSSLLLAMTSIRCVLPNAACLA